MFGPRSRISGQKRFEEAEPLLIEGYQGLVSRKDQISPVRMKCLPESIDRLIELYKATNRPEEQQKYERLRAEYPAPKPIEEVP